VTPLSASQDFRWMAAAIRLARRGRYTASPRPLVGCLLVRDGLVVGQGVHLQPCHPDDAIRTALADAAGRSRGSTLYLTLTPSTHWCVCPVKALLDAGICRVVLAGSGMDWLEPITRMRQAGIMVETGLLQQEADGLNEAWNHRLKNGRPWVTVKLAMSLDGRTALSNGQSKWITGLPSRTDVHRQRAEACAILSGADTVILDDALLNVRWPPGAAYPGAVIRQPLRVVIDSRQRLFPGLKMFALPSPILLAYADTSTRDWPGHVDTFKCPLSMGGKIDLRVLLEELARRGLNSVWVEAGATLAGAFLQQQLVDRLVVYMAPKLMGGHARGLLELPCFSSMQQVPQLHLLDVRQLGDDLKLTYRLEPSPSIKQTIPSHLPD
jgi:diaminohydroxyphosphoribosylaminopyrimidine deaminase/5-amino-6-(5-phosphoribosylamino)uracil reductase